MLAYNAGRVLSYTMAGVLAGGASQAGLMLRGSMPLQQAFMFAAALSLWLLALYLAGIGMAPLMRLMESAGAVLWRRVQPIAQGLLPVDSIPKAMALGMMWGWLPCGMVYAVLLLALGSGNAVQGGIVMLAFGLGTLPNMMLLGGLMQRMHHALKQHKTLRLAAAGIIAGVGLYGMVHAVHPHAFSTIGVTFRPAP